MLDSWFNYKTGRYEEIETPKNFKDYLPQSEAAQGLYDVYIAMGNKPSDAAIKVLKACAGIMD